MTQLTRLLRSVSSYVGHKLEKHCRSSYKSLNSTFDGSEVSETRAFSSLEGGGGENSSEYSLLLSCDSLSYLQSCDAGICRSEKVSHHLDNLVIGSPKTLSSAPPVGYGGNGSHANETAGYCIRHSWNGSFVIGNGYMSVAR